MAKYYTNINKMNIYLSPQNNLTQKRPTTFKDDNSGHGFGAATKMSLLTMFNLIL